MSTPTKRAPQARKKLYPHVLDLTRFRLKELHDRELSIRAASVEFRDLPNWTEKLKNRSFVTDWLRERQRIDFEEYEDGKDPHLKPLVWGRDDVTMWYNELAAYKHYVRRLQRQGFLGIEPDAEGVWRGDGIVDEEVRKGLVDAAAILENVPEDQQLWREPQSSSSSPVVLDLVDPSMWPIIYDQTPATNGLPLLGPSYHNDEELRASDPKYCWLPSEFKVSEDGKRTKITSYINNLASPREEAVFKPVLEKIFTAFVPLFNHVLAETEAQLWTGSRCIDPTPWKSRAHDGTLVASKEACMKASTELLDQMEKTGQMSDTFEGIGVLAHSRPEDYQSMFPIKNSLNLIQDAIWKPPKPSKLKRLEGRTAKVIVSMVNIMLSPENPEYQAEEWQLNGVRNERIIATGVYYYAQENINETYLALRRRSFGRAKITPREIEWVKTKENRAIVYPNFYEHRIPSFTLTDKTKPGHSKMLIFHYCDPCELHGLPTTKEIYPQQPHVFESRLRSSKLGNLPEEIFSQIINYLQIATISRKEAEDRRYEMNQWRKSWVHDGDGYYSEYERDHYYGMDPIGYGFAYSSEDEGN
ncbi:hypothetical protein TWF506_002516 [Arthrobotrys conoides]|uniref:Uncharacterized protein n=1 Tax=Arthrobotrys conoides TaxID=74498 RepID=A0AAN8ND57_9PEZI